MQQLMYNKGGKMAEMEKRVWKELLSIALTDVNSYERRDHAIESLIIKYFKMQLLIWTCSL